MFHSLKTLYQHTAKHEKWLADQFLRLENYCLNEKEIEHADGLNRGFNSVKYFVYKLRDQLPQKELEDAFYYLLCECQNRETLLYQGIKKTKTWFRYRKFLEVQPPEA